jgi:hypothetical protein
MTTKPSTTNTVEQLITTLTTETRALAAKVESFTVTLAPQSRRSALRFRRGGDTVVSRIARLAAKHDLGGTGLGASTMLSDLHLAQVLLPLQTELAALSQRVEDTILKSKSDCWQSTTRCYSVLEALSRGNPDLLTELQPVQEFFSTRKRKTKPAPVKTGSEAMKN